MNLNAYLLTYDIPDDSGIANPSPRLRRRGFRVNLSCWVIQERDIPYTLIHHMQQFGAVVHMVKFDHTEGEKIALMAVNAIRKDILDSINSCRESLRNLERGRNGVIPNDVDEALKAEKKYRNRSKAVVKRLQSLLADLRAVTDRFDLTPESVGLNATNAVIETLQTGITMRAKAYTEAIQRLRRVVGDNNAMVKAARNGQVPAFALTDYMLDNGLPAEAAALQSRFE